MKITIDSLLIPGITAAVGFVWLLAYKHPKTYRALAVPVILMAMMGLLVSVGYLLAWDVYGMQLASYNDIWEPFSGVEKISEIQKAVEGRVGQIGKEAITPAVICLAVAVLMTFFSWISHSIHQERQSENSKGNKED